jgi:hypothetical protein
MDIKSEVLRQEEAEKIVKDLIERKDLTDVEAMILDNKIEFDYKDKKYRVRMLSLNEKRELHELRLAKYGRLLNNADILTEQQLIKVYKEKEIANIEQMNDDIKKIEIEIRSLSLKEGEALANKESLNVLNEYKEKILELQFKRQVLSYQKADLLSYSLQNQLENYVAEYITYLSFDVLIDEKWERVFKSYEEFTNCEDDMLITQAGLYSMKLQG